MRPCCRFTFTAAVAAVLSLYLSDDAVIERGVAEPVLQEICRDEEFQHETRASNSKIYLGRKCDSSGSQYNTRQIMEFLWK